jgi:hypothetical protein
MIQNFGTLLFDPYPHRTLMKRLITGLKLGGYGWRIEIGAVERPHYGYCIYNGALLAKRLGYKKISVIEFGVAGGAGLINIEYHAEQTARILGIQIEVYGFDMGKGLPRPIDYRDLPYYWRKGFFKMDKGKVQRRLRFAKLIIGDIRHTARRFIMDCHPAPIAAVMIDFDLYSSTIAGLKLFDIPERYLLPRIFCYFDDTIGSEIELYNDYTGERLAINEFNRMHKYKKFCVPYHLLGQKVVEQWCHQISIFHHFRHSKYNQFIGEENQQLLLE